MAAYLRQVLGLREWMTWGTATYYNELIRATGGSALGTTLLAQPVSISSRLRRLRVWISGAPGSGKTRTVTLLKNGVATGLTVTFGAADTYKEDLVNEVDMAPGDCYLARFTSTGSPASCNVKVLVYLDSGTARDWCPLSRTTPSVADADYWSAPWPIAVTASAHLHLCVFPFHCKRIDVAVYTAPGAGASVTLTLAKNGVSTEVTATISGANTTASADCDIAYIAGDKFHWYVSRSGGSSQGVRFSARCVNDAADFAWLMTGVRGNPDSTAERYMNPESGTEYAAEADALQLQSDGLTIRGAAFILSGSTGAGKSYSVYLRHGGADKHGGVLTGASGTPSVIDVDHAKDFDFAGDLAESFCWVARPSGTPTSRSVYPSYWWSMFHGTPGVDQAQLVSISTVVPPRSQYIL